MRSAHRSLLPIVLVACAFPALFVAASSTAGLAFAGAPVLFSLSGSTPGKEQVTATATSSPPAITVTATASSTPATTITLIPSLTPSNTPTTTPSASPGATPPPGCDPVWRTVESPNVGANPSWVTSIDTLTAEDVWATVRYARDGGHGLEDFSTMHWDGTAWSLVPAEQQTVYGETLESIKAIFPNDVWAVGHYCPGAPAACRTLTEHWNGSAWSAVPSPNNALDGDYLNGLAVVSIDDMWAVGFSLVPGPPPYRNHSEPLTMRWDGSAWSIVPAAIPPGYGGALESVAAVGPDDVWAVGGYAPLGESGRTLTMHWDGLSWSVVPSPNSGSYSSTLKAVGVVSPTEVWAVGEGSLSTLTMRWNGSGWSAVPSPSAPGTNYVHGLAIASANNMVLAGYSYDGAIHELLLRWNGAQWTPEQGSHAGGYFYGVAALPGGDFWAAGMRGFTDNTTLVEQYGLTEPFSDVTAADYFYDAVRHLYCERAISGYADGTFRPYNNTTRGQLAKIVTRAEGWPINTAGGPHFSDVSPGSAFYDYVETAFNRGVTSGYADGTFRPGSDVTRGQICKIVVLAEGWPINTTGGPHFGDVPAGSVFYTYVETAFNRGIITGYSDGTFRPGNSATRGQIAKIVYNAVTAP